VPKLEQPPKRDSALKPVQDHTDFLNFLEIESERAIAGNPKADSREIEGILDKNLDYENLQYVARIPNSKSRSKLSNSNSNLKPSWTPEEAGRWTTELKERLKGISCENCASYKITQVVMGRPYLPYYDWARLQNEKLGWPVFKFGGCVPTGQTDVCVDCQAESPTTTTKRAMQKTTKRGWGKLDGFDFGLETEGKPRKVSKRQQAGTATTAKKRNSQRIKQDAAGFTYGKKNFVETDKKTKKKDRLGDLSYSDSLEEKDIYGKADLKHKALQLAVLGILSKVKDNSPPNPPNANLFDIIDAAPFHAPGMSQINPDSKNIVDGSMRDLKSVKIFPPKIQAHEFFRHPRITCSNEQNRFFGFRKMHKLKLS
jgi:hypothetical protein